MDCSPASVLSPDELSVIQAVAAELQDPQLTPERRSELMLVINEIADRYACDPRLADD